MQLDPKLLQMTDLASERQYFINISSNWNRFTNQLLFFSFDFGSIPVRDDKGYDLYRTDNKVQMMMRDREATERWSRKSGNYK